MTAYKLPVRAAVDAPRLHHQWLPDVTQFENGAISTAAQFELAGMGHTLRQRPAQSQGDAHSIWYDPATKIAYGAADHRSPDSKASPGARPAASVRRSRPACGSTA